MGMSAGGSGGGRRGGRKSVMAEINVTPMVDVMLVLLIIFMVAAPLMTTSIEVSLPSARGGAPPSPDAQQVTLVVKRTTGNCNSEASFYLNDTLFQAGELEGKIGAIRATRSEADAVVNVLGDKNVCYSDMMKVIGILRNAGFKASAAVLPE